MAPRLENKWVRKVIKGHDTLVTHRIENNRFRLALFWEKKHAILDNEYGVVIEDLFR